MYILKCLWVLALSFALLATAAPQDDIEPGTPLYECHYDCGYGIVAGQSCGSGNTACLCASGSNFTTDYEACLECAAAEDVWQYYGSDLVSYATQCSGLATTPYPASTTAAGTSASASSSGLTTSNPLTSAASTGSVPSASSAPSSTVATSVSSSAVSAASANVTSITTSTASATAVFTGGVGRTQVPAVMGFMLFGLIMV